MTFYDSLSVSHNPESMPFCLKIKLNSITLFPCLTFSIKNDIR